MTNRTMTPDEMERAIRSAHALRAQAIRALVLRLFRRPARLGLARA